MGNFSVKGQYQLSGDLHDTSAVVHAKDLSSAQAQLNWLLDNNHCFCSDCCDEYVKDYSTTVQVPQRLMYSMCVK